MSQKNIAGGSHSSPKAPNSTRTSGSGRRGSEKDALAARQRRERELRKNPYREPDLGGVANVSYERPFVALLLTDAQARALLAAAEVQKCDTSLVDYIKEKMHWTSQRNRTNARTSARKPSASEWMPEPTSVPSNDGNALSPVKKASHQRRRRKS